MSLRRKVRLLCAAGVCVLGLTQTSNAATVTDPNDARNWQGATVGTFATLYYGSNTATTRQQVVDDQLLDDGIFDPTGYVAGTLLNTPWAQGTGGGSHQQGNTLGRSTDSTGTGDFGYYTSNPTIDGKSLYDTANAIDDYWFQSSDTVGDTVFDLGFQATKAAVFNTIDHGPLPQEAIESTIYLSNDKVTWTEATVERVWLEGFKSNTGILWDGFVYAVGTGTSDTFRYLSVIHGGPGALINDGDNEINGVMGLRGDFTGHPDVPIPAAAWIGLTGCGLIAMARRRNQIDATK